MKKFMEKSNFLELLIVEPIKDILVGGFIDSEEHMEFHPLFNYLYFIFENIKVLICVGKEPRIAFEIVEKIEPRFDVDEDDQFALMSVYSLVFRTETAVRVLAAICEDTDFAGLKLTYCNGAAEKSVTLEPLNIFGFTFEYD